ncbi:MAG: hypothetical protein O2901_12180 [Verrucomicrobia bacterium]|nr:hypothetical protein [Verrucomicrobiota bacterium]
MKAIFSIFPKFFDALSIEELAASMRIIKREVACLRGILAEVAGAGRDAFGQ